MNESQFTAKLLKALRAHPTLKDAVILKHNDRTTRGIPDFSISISSHTEWFEVKMFPKKPTPIQAYFIKKLHMGVAWIRADINGKAANMYWRENTGDTADRFTFDGLVAAVVRRCVND